MKIVIVEDEPLVAVRLERMLREVLGERLISLRSYRSFEEARRGLNSQLCDVLFLDLNLQGDDGMALLTEAVAGAFQTIIVSANTDRAIDAFAHGVLDFVAKPFTRERLAHALDRLHAPSAPAQPARFLAIKKTGGIDVVPVATVKFIRGADSYAEVITADGRAHLSNKTLEALAAILPGEFVRIHKSYLVRLADIRSLHSAVGSRYEAELRDGQRLPVGRSRYPEIRDRLLSV